MRSWLLLLLLASGGLVLGGLRGIASAGQVGDEEEEEQEHENEQEPPSSSFDTVVSAGAMNCLPSFSFEMVVSAGAMNCLPEARARVTITPLGPVEVMRVKVKGLPANTEFDFFVIQVPTKPFGLSWYQGDIETDEDGEGRQKFIGRFNIETFIVAPDTSPAPVVHCDGMFPDADMNPPTPPVHTFHLGLWFNSPDDAEKAGCPSTVTPFNGDHHAGIQVLNTSNFPDLAGPLSHVMP